MEATTEAVREQFPDKKILACVELHTFSSLNKNFLSQYKGRLDAADLAVVYYNAHTLAIKRLEPITPEDVKAAFGRTDLQVFTETADLQAWLLQQLPQTDVLLLMSSGTFGGLDLNTLI